VATVELQLPLRSVYVGVARLAVAGIARTAGFDEEVIHDLKIAVSEALANAVLYGERGEDPARLLWTDTDEGAIIDVAFSGSLEEPEIDSLGAERQEMSLALLRSLVHECEFISREDGGTTTRLNVKR
jgi:serine/threonine-protein kinase RsbW